jgi:hypothetical protein
MVERSINDMFGKKISVINLGLDSMAQAVREQGAAALQVDWHPPRAGIPHLEVTREGVDIDQANAEVCQRIRSGRPVLVGMGIAKDVVPGMHAKMILHAGPPITWERMCGPTRGAVMGALIYEGMAKDEEEAGRLAASGEIEFSPCHHHGSVGPMAGIISPRMPVFIIKNETFGNLAYATQNEGLGKVLRYGAMGPEVYERLRWMEETLYPVLVRALEIFPDGIDIKTLIAQALHMGDECHNRNRAATSLLIRSLAPALVRTSINTEDTARVLEFMNRNDHFFLNLSMAAGKACLQPAEGVAGSTVVTVMARNGTDFGIRIASLPEQWFTASAGIVKGLYLPGFKAGDANPDIGDSTVTETAGYGGFAMAAAPAITQFVGGTPSQALQATLEMYEICAGEHEDLTIPALNFRGTPLGIDIRRVAESGILPQINTGIAHKQPGIGMVGAGILRAPMPCFEAALVAFQKTYC